MYAKATLPLYVCLDDGEVMRIDSVDKVLYHLEAIDIENDEYMFWDAAGQGFRVLINKGQVDGFEKTDNKIALQQAFEEYALQLAERGVPVDTSGTPDEIWAKMEKAKQSLAGRHGFFSRLFRGKASQ